MSRFIKTYCSQCGLDLCPGGEGVSRCEDHRIPSSGGEAKAVYSKEWCMKMAALEGDHDFTVAGGEAKAGERDELMRLLTEYEGALADSEGDESAIEPARTALTDFLRPIRQELDARASAQQSDAAKPLIDKEIEEGWHATFSTSNPYCPCNLKSFTKAVRWAERASKGKKS